MLWSLKVTLGEDKEYQMILRPHTHFMQESGGQVGDSGYLRNLQPANGKMRDQQYTQKMNDILYSLTGLMEQGQIKDW